MRIHLRSQLQPDAHEHFVHFILQDKVHPFLLVVANLSLKKIIEGFEITLCKGSRTRQQQEGQQACPPRDCLARGLQFGGQLVFAYALEAMRQYARLELTWWEIDLNLKLDDRPLQAFLPKQRFDEVE